MLSIIRDWEGNILACCEWFLVNDRYFLDDNGTIVWIQEVEVAKKYRGTGVLKKFIKIITDKVPWAKAGYFSRRKYDGRTRIYSRRQWLNLVRRK